MNHSFLMTHPVMAATTAGTWRPVSGYSQEDAVWLIFHRLEVASPFQFV